MNKCLALFFHIVLPFLLFQNSCLLKTLHKSRFIFILKVTVVCSELCHMISLLHIGDNDFSKYFLCVRNIIFINQAIPFSKDSVQYFVANKMSSSYPLRVCSCVTFMALLER